MRFGSFIDYDEINGFIPGTGFRFLDAGRDEVDDVRLYNFLHGYCEHFALALHDLLGLSIFKVYANDRLVHAYCTTLNGIFVDVRGGTSEADEFWREFKSELFGPFERIDYDSIVGQPVSEEWITKKKNHDIWLTEFAKKIIREQWFLPALSDVLRKESGRRCALKNEYIEKTFQQ